MARACAIMWPRLKVICLPVVANLQSPWLRLAHAFPHETYPDPNPNPNRNPNQVWPDYPCNEQEGRGWLVQIEWVAEAGGQSTAQVRFVVDEEYDPQELDVSLARGLTLILTLFLPRTRTRTRTLALTPTPSLTPTSRPTPTVTR